MTLYIDNKYALMISSELPLFKKKGDYVYDFRCPICGDSDKSKTKKRGYFYPRKDDDMLMMCCKNCGASHKFSTFLKMQDELLYKEYIYEKFNYNNTYRWNDKKTEEQEVDVEKVLLDNAHDDAISNLQCIADLPDDHICKQYVKSRKIPFKYYKELYYTDNYMKFINEYVDETKFKLGSKSDKKHDRDFDQRLVIPFKNKDGKIFAYQGRSLSDSEKVIRYITIRKSEDGMLLYGFDKVDNKKDNVYVLEGPIDSMFIPNSIAVAGSALTKLIDRKMKKLVFVFDNEPRSKEICALMQKAIDADCRIVIFPEKVTEKDINKMIINGLSSKEVLDIIEENTYNNKLQAQLQFNKWKKI